MEPRLYCLHETAGFKPRFCVCNSCVWISCSRARQVYQVITFALPAIYLRQIRCTISVRPSHMTTETKLQSNNGWPTTLQPAVCMERDMAQNVFGQKENTMYQINLWPFCVNWEHEALLRGSDDSDYVSERSMHLRVTWAGVWTLESMV